MTSRLSIGRKFLLLAFGMGLGKIITLSAMPLLTRIYEPSHFAELTLYNSIITLLAPLVSLRLLLGIPTAKDDNAAYLILKLSVLVSLCLSVLLMLLVFAFQETITDNMVSLGSMIFLLPLSVFLVSSVESISMYATRENRFRLLSKVAIYQSTSETFFKIILKALTDYGLILGQLAQQVAGLIYLLLTQKDDLKKFERFNSVSKFKDVFFELMPVIRYRILAQCLVSLSVTMPIFFTTYFYSKGTLGQLSLAITAIALPVNLLAGGLSRVILAEICSVNIEDASSKLKVVNSLIVKTFFVGFLPALILFLYGGEIFILVFGEAWHQAGKLASVLSILMLFEICLSPCQQILTAINSHREYLKLSLIRLFVYIASLYLGYIVFLSIEEVIYMYAISGALFFLYAYICSVQELKK